MKPGQDHCQRCRYAYYGKPVRNKRGEKIDEYAYYRCIGTDAYRFGGTRVCDNKQIRTDTLEIAVWEEIKYLLKNPSRIAEEHQKRLMDLEKVSVDKTDESLEKQRSKLQRGISRLIDSYTEGSIDKEEFDPRIKMMKKNLMIVEEQKKKIRDQRDIKNELRFLITQLENFSTQVQARLDNIDWYTQRDIIRTLVKRVEINLEEINVVFRVADLPSLISKQEEEKNTNLQHCCGRNWAALWNASLASSLEY